MVGDEDWKKVLLGMCVYTHENLSSDIQYPHKKPGWHTLVILMLAGRGRKTSVAPWPSSEHLVSTYKSILTHIQMCMHTHTHIHTLRKRKREKMVRIFAFNPQRSKQKECNRTHPGANSLRTR